jgi:hypothetical protein
MFLLSSAPRVLCRPTAVLLGSLLLGIGATTTSQAKEVTIDTFPVKEGRVYVNGEYVGVAPVTTDVKFGVFFQRSKVHIATADLEGAIHRWNTRFDRKSRTVSVRVENDEHYGNTIEGDVANKWLAVSPRTHTEEQECWKRIVSVVTDNFSDLESLDGTSMYLRTAWRVRQFKHRVARSRLVVKRNTTTGLGFKVRLESQVMNTKQNAKQAENYQPSSRVFVNDKETIDYLRDQI